MSVMRPIVFLGPSLSLDRARTSLSADFRPPAAQGDVYRACLARPPAIGLIDGVFKDVPTVRHREILWALGCGIPVFGAASMGALRAAELAPCGMIGVGLIYRWYRRFDLLPDDAVAVTHAPPELGSVPTSQALVDLRRTIRRAERRGHLGRDAARDMIERLSRLPFPQRMLPQTLAPFAVRQKERDARALLRLMARCAAEDRWPRLETAAPAVVHAWMDDLADSGLPIPP